MWNSIKNDNDLGNFLYIVKNFHDSCIKEIKYLSGAYISEDLSMHPINDKRILRMIIQTQNEKVPAIELEFSNLKFLKLFPMDENYTCEILSATMFFLDDLVCWCDSDCFSKENIEKYNGTIVCAKKVQWRIENKYIGVKEVYKDR